jgi:hypothetical protein
MYGRSNRTEHVMADPDESALVNSEMADQDENDRDYLRLMKSPENGLWYAQDAEGQTITHGHRYAWRCVEVAMRIPYTPRKFS